MWYIIQYFIFSTNGSTAMCVRMWPWSLYRLRSKYSHQLLVLINHGRKNNAYTVVPPFVNRFNNHWSGEWWYPSHDIMYGSVGLCPMICGHNFVGLHFVVSTCIVISRDWRDMFFHNHQGCFSAAWAINCMIAPALVRRPEGYGQNWPRWYPNFTLN